MIDQDEDGIIVRDCGSHNGTIVNGALLGGSSIGFRAVLGPRRERDYCRHSDFPLSVFLLDLAQKDATDPS